MVDCERHHYRPARLMVANMRQAAASYSILMLNKYVQTFGFPIDSSRKQTPDEPYWGSEHLASVRNREIDESCIQHSLRTVWTKTKYFWVIWEEITWKHVKKLHISNLSCLSPKWVFERKSIAKSFFSTRFHQKSKTERDSQLLICSL